MTTSAADLRSLVDALVAEPLDGLDAPALQARIVALTPQVARHGEHRLPDLLRLVLDQPSPGKCCGDSW